MARRWFWIAMPGLIAAVLLLGCSSVSRRHDSGTSQATSTKSEAGAAEKEPTTGMSKADVRGLWGEPREVVPDPNLADTETWTYERTVGSGAATEGRSARAVVRRTIYRLTFTGDKLTKIMKQVL